MLNFIHVQSLDRFRDLFESVNAHSFVLIGSELSVGRVRGHPKESVNCPCLIGNSTEIWWKNVAAAVEVAASTDSDEGRHDGSNIIDSASEA